MAVSAARNALVGWFAAGIAYLLLAALTPSTVRQMTGGVHHRTSIE